MQLRKQLPKMAAFNGGNLKGIFTLLVTLGMAGFSNLFAEKPDVEQIFGRIQIVTSFPDYKVQVTESFADLHVEIVTSFPDQPGRWQIVDSFPDFKIQLVDSFPDFTIKYVKAFPGVP